MVAHFFPREGEEATDRLFRHIPNDVRGPVLTAWGIRGSNSARRDDDEKVKTVVNDALIAGDLDDAKFEEGITPQLLVDWVALSDWWTFWRKGKLTGVAIRKALATARELGLIDDKWFFENLEGRGGRLKGTDVVCDTLTKDQIIAWLKNVHASGDGSPSGLVAAIGWETVLQKTAEDALLFALDAFAKKTKLVGEPAEVAPASQPKVEPSSTAKLQKVEIAETDETSSIPVEESPKLAEARAAMLKVLNDPAPAPAPAIKTADESEVPARPSALEWGDQGVTADAGSVDIIPVTDDESVPVMQAAPPAKARSAPPTPPKKAPLPRAR